MQEASSNRIPVVDLFAGPGGLGEGFSRYDFHEQPQFKVVLSVEKEENAHRTLLTRAFYREFSPGDAPDAYYMHLRGEITQEEMFQFDNRCTLAASEAKKEALCMELGEPAEGNLSKSEKRKQRLRIQRKLRKLIRERVQNHDHWVLIGGPPCQAYSLAGRSRMKGVVRRSGETLEEYEERRKDVVDAFEGDHRHLLYREYLSIIGDHWPSVFVMENVRGLLSARLEGRLVFPMIKRDLEDPNQALNKKRKGYKYRVYSLVVPELVAGAGFESEDYLIRAEDYGVPQQRHRVILLGVRDDLEIDRIPVLKKQKNSTVEEVLRGLPPLHPGVTKPPRPIGPVLEEIRKASWLTNLGSGNFCGIGFRKLKMEIENALEKAASKQMGQGSRFLRKTRAKAVPGELGSWLADPLLGGVCNHETKGHMSDDLHRYLFVSAFGKVFERSPTLSEFPEELLPNHKNVQGKNKDLKKFADRFRVQLASSAAKTITCHISKDGHANIHPDPSQLRALTVREAARIQTFPDNYFFEGEKTAQYQQVGNAVPPFLAHQIAGIVSQIIDQAGVTNKKQALK